jgi:long-chain acyl-CoA synthetase
VTVGADAPHTTLPQWWRACCRAGGDGVAMRHKQRGIWAGVTWRAHFAQARGCALGLERRGLRRGDVVSIWSENRPEWLAAFFGTQALGLIAHGIDPALPPHRLARVLREAGTRAIVVEHAAQAAQIEALGDACPALGLVIVLNVRGLGAGSVALPWASLAEGDADTDRFEAAIDGGSAEAIASIAGSAGRGGAPVLSAFEQRQLVAQLRALSGWMVDQDAARALPFVSFAHLGELTLAAGLLLSQRCLLHFAEGPDTVLNDLREVGPALIHAPARFWERQQSRAELAMRDALPLARGLYRRSLEGRAPAARWLLRNLRAALGLQRTTLAITSGARLDPRIVAWYAALGVRLVDAYHVTAAGGFCAVQAPLPGVQWRTVQRGEIRVRGPGVATATWRAGSLTTGSADAEGWIATGDRGTLDDGLRLLGRIDDVAEAVAHEAAMLEAALRASPYIAESALVYGPERALRALVVLDNDAIAAHAQAERIVYVDAADLLRHAAVETLIAREIAAANGRIAGAVEIVAFRIVDVPREMLAKALTAHGRLRRPWVLRLAGRGADACATASASPWSPVPGTAAVPAAATDPAVAIEPARAAQAA